MKTNGLRSMNSILKNNNLTKEERDEMIALKNAINELPQAVIPEKMEKFSEYFVRSLKEMGN
jgi:hypothetical protein